MKIWQRYLTAWSRHHRSAGFGIHSPYAFRFVLDVWSQPLPYYSYDGLPQLIGTIKGGLNRRKRRAIDLIAWREAKLLFRVTNFFNPHAILQVGLSTGVESVAMLEVSRASRLWLLDERLEHKQLGVTVLRSQLERVQCYDDETVAVDEFLAANAGSEGCRLALVNEPAGESALHRLLDDGVVVVMRNLRHDAMMERLFDSCCRHMTAGQTFTDGNIAVLLPNAKLQREDFLLSL